MMSGVVFDSNVALESDDNESQVHLDACNSLHDALRVALVTLHRSANYGSVLQALATQIVLERMGCEVQVVDYYPYRNTIRSMLRGLKEKTPLLKKNPIALAMARAILLPSYLKRRRVFDKYIKENLNLTSETYRDATELECAALKADVFITGSDQVWNSEWNGGIDEPLFLSFAPRDARRLSFSASFGKGDLEPGERKRTVELLSAYESISVREGSGVEIIRSLGLDAVQVLDPTLFLDAEEWGACCASKAPKGNYILMYNINHNRPLDKFVRARFLSRRDCRFIIFPTSYMTGLKRGICIAAFQWKSSSLLLKMHDMSCAIRFIVRHIRSTLIRSLQSSRQSVLELALLAS